MVIIALSNKVKKIKVFLNNEARWCYIGKDTARKERITEALGEENRLYLTDKLYTIAKQLRQPFIDSLAALGRKQQNQLNWWATKVASRSPFQTDSFLLFCCKPLVNRLIQEYSLVNNSIAILIEDPWLFAEIKKIAASREVKFIGTPAIFLAKLSCFVRGIIYRLLLLGWFIVARALMHYWHRGKKPAAVTENESAMCILSPVQMRSGGDSYSRDNYLPGLAELYKKKGIPYFYLFYHLPFSFSAGRYAGKNKEDMWPLVLDIRLSDVIKRIFQWWAPILDNQAFLGSSALIEREKYLEFSRVGFNIHLIFYDALNNFFRRRWCRALVYLFENQPWEKMLCLAAQRNNVKAAGYQHSIAWKLSLSYFIGKEERNFLPLPEKIIASGNCLERLYRDSGMPLDKIIVGGAWRYLHLQNDNIKDVFKKSGSSGRLTILVALPIDAKISHSMLKNIFKSISRNPFLKEVKFLLKPHPATPLNKLKLSNKIFSAFYLVDKPFKEILKEADIVLSSASSSSLEAFLCGKGVISYIPDNLISADPMLDIEDGLAYKWFEGETLGIDYLKGLGEPFPWEKIESIRNDYFSQIKEEVWLGLASGLTQE